MTITTETAAPRVRTLAVLGSSFSDLDRLRTAWNTPGLGRAPQVGPRSLAEYSLPAPSNPKGGATRSSAADEGALDRAMDLYARGEDRAFAAVHRALHERLRLFLLRLCRTPALADDLLQEAFLRIHRARGSFAAGSRVLPWAYAIARNVHIDYARSVAARRMASLDEEDEDGKRGFEPAAGPGTDAEAVSIAQQTARTVEAALASLPVSQREAFVLIRYEGMSVADAARILGTTENAVKLRAFHAYEALRAALGIEKEKRKGGKEGAGT